MSMLDGVMGQISQNPMIVALAAKVGMSADQVQSAITALVQHHPLPGDTAQGAATSTGLPLDKIRALIAQIGGEGALAQVAGLAQTHGASVLGALDKDGDGNPVNDVAGMAASFFGRK